jgi:hypothetical protein
MAEDKQNLTAAARHNTAEACRVPRCRVDAKLPRFFAFSGEPSLSSLVTVGGRQSSYVDPGLDFPSSPSPPLTALPSFARSLNLQTSC